MLLSVRTRLFKILLSVQPHIITYLLANISTAWNQGITAGSQHYSSALQHFCCALSTVSTGQESSICWSLTILRRRRPFTETNVKLHLTLGYQHSNPKWVLTFAIRWSRGPITPKCSFFSRILRLCKKTAYGLLRLFKKYFVPKMTWKTFTLLFCVAQ